MQKMLYRGEQLDRFGSKEIITETVAAGLVFYLFIVHIFTAEQPFINPGIFLERNFSAGVLFVSIGGLTYCASHRVPQALL